MKVSSLVAPLLWGSIATACPGDGPGLVSAGQWGGEHIGMVVSDSGAQLEYDCADGRITEPLRFDERGNFEWQGVHVPGHGGPAREGEQLESRPARYTGRVTGDVMTLTLSVTDGSQPPQTFTLLRNAQSRVFRCL